MSEQDGTQPPMKRRRNRTSTIAIQEQGKQVPAAQCPASDDTEAWRAYWKAQGQPWRTEPEIDPERQQYLAEKRSIKPDEEQGIYPFKDVKLSRGDVEWLLASHENGRGPVDWSDEGQRKRQGLDLRGANFSREDLHGLPLACLQGGLTVAEFFAGSEVKKNMAALHLEQADLCEAQLQGAILSGAHLEGADLSEAQLQGATLYKAQLQRASLDRAQLQGAYLREARLQEAYLIRAQFQGADLCEVVLADQQYHGSRLADAQWGDTNLAVVDWAQVSKLGDEYVAVQEGKKSLGKKDVRERLGDYKTAVRAYRQLAVVLRNQGLNEDAARFAYRAQLMQRQVYRYQHKFAQYFGSLFLDLLAGYSYRPWRSFSSVPRRHLHVRSSVLRDWPHGGAIPVASWGLGF